MRRIWKIILTMVGAGAVLMGAAFLYFTFGLEEGKQVEIGNVDLDSLENKVYQGQYEHGRWSNKVAVEIKNNKIKRIEVVDDMLVVNKEVAGQLFNRVIQEQTPDVDVVTGATVTSKAYLKAIENALKQK